MDWVLAPGRDAGLPDRRRCPLRVFSKSAAPEQPPPAGGGGAAERDAARERAGQPRRQAVRPGGLRGDAVPPAGRAHLPPLHAQQPRPLAPDHGAAGRASPSRGIIWYGGARVIADPREAGASFVAFLAAVVAALRAVQEAGADELHDPAGHRGRGARLRAPRHAPRDRRPSRARVALRGAARRHRVRGRVVRVRAGHAGAARHRPPHPGRQGRRAGRHERRRQEHARPT